MENKKRAIILDMDETLEHGIFKSMYGSGEGAMMVLRPNLDELITKLQEAKEQGVDIILCTTAQEQWMERFLTLKPEFRTIFNKMLTQDNEKEWKDYNREENPFEYEAEKQECNLRDSKPITTFGYDSILFIDDNKTKEYGTLKELFEITQGKLEKDVTYFSGFSFNGGTIEITEMLGYKKISKTNPEIAKKLEQYLELERKNPGCSMMCSVIDTFMEKEFIPGLTLADEGYSKEYDNFYNEKEAIEEELEDIAWNLQEQTGEELFGYSENELKELEEYLNSDKAYPYEGIDTEQKQNKTNREKLSELVETAIDTQTKLNEAQKLKESYDQYKEKE